MSPKMTAVRASAMATISALSVQGSRATGASPVRRLKKARVIKPVACGATPKISMRIRPRVRYMPGAKDRQLPQELPGRQLGADVVLRFRCSVLSLFSRHASTSSIAGLQQAVKARFGVAGQRGARAVLADAALLQDHDLVGALHRAQAVGDDDGRAVLDQRVHGALDQVLGGRVQARRGLVEDDQARVLQKDARKGQQLRLARRQPAAARFQLGVQPVGQARVPRRPGPGRGAPAGCARRGCSRSKKVRLSRTLA